MACQAVILAAGVGSRLGRAIPKPLVELRNGRSILEEQISGLRNSLPGVRITIVVGYRRELIMEAFPDVSYVSNERFEQTNTSKSLLRALEVSRDSGVLWLNGDVVFDPGILERISDRIADERSLVCVNRASVGDEEVAYTIDDAGFIEKLSKNLPDGLGEAIGINFIGARDKPTLIRRLTEADDQDYFERGLEVAVAEDGLRLEPVDISDLYAVEVDFEADLRRANRRAGFEFGGSIS